MSDFGREAELWRQGFRRIAGVDEAGYGPLAGPVVVGAVILPRRWPERVRLDDSKRLTPPQRERAYAEIRARALAWRLAVVPPAEIDRINVLQATLKGMTRAVEGLWPAPDYVLVDGKRTPRLGVPCQALVGGDGLCHSIAAASILAKVVRDRIMAVYGRRFPAWGFERHKGYGTPAHVEALLLHGLSPIHRTSYRIGAGVGAGRGEIGRRGETTAARYLERQGYRLLERNFRCPLGEIDLIAGEGEYLVFVEVKTRTAGSQVHPSAAVNRPKRQRLRQLGEYYLSHHPELALQPRFDVIAVELGGATETVEHFVNAF